MDATSILKRLDVERRSLARHGETVETLPDVTRVTTIGGQVWVEFSGVDESTADDAITREVAHFRSTDAREFEWKVYGHDQPADLRERLANAGFTVGDKETVLVLDLSQPPAWLSDTPEIPVRQVSDSHDLELFRAADEAIFGGEDRSTTDELARTLEAGSTDHLGFIAVEDETAVSIGRLYTHPQSHFGGLYGGGTRPTHRGRGNYRAVIAARAREAIRLGARYLIVDALPTSQPILERLGFVKLTETWPCRLSKPSDPGG